MGTHLRCLKITENVSFFKIASEASYVTSNSVARTKIDQITKIEKNQMRLFKVIFKQWEMMHFDYLLFCRLKTVWMTMSWTVSVGCTAVLICPQISNSHVREKNLTEGTCTIRIISGSPFSWLLMPDFFTFQDASGWLLKEDSCPTWSKVSSKKSSFSPSHLSGNNKVQVNWEFCKLKFKWTLHEWAFTCNVVAKY